MTGKRQKSGNIVVVGSLMQVMKKSCVIILAAFMMGCQEENLPIGLYDYQVVRLLASDSAKVWFRTQYVENGAVTPIETCRDSIYGSFVLHERYPQVDSAYYYEIIPKSDCSAFDTLIIGKFAASSVSNVFTDSLNFGDGPVDFMIIDNITSRFTRLDYQRAGVNVSASFEAVQ